MIRRRFPIRIPCDTCEGRKATSGPVESLWAHTYSCLIIRCPDCKGRGYLIWYTKKRKGMRRGVRHVGTEKSKEMTRGTRHVS